MKRNVLNFSASVALAVSLLAGCTASVDNAYEVAADNATRADYSVNRVPSQQPPAGLLPAQAPQFVIFGWDDNQYADGMYNILDIYKGITNPAGSGNAATYDGTGAKSSFYVTPGGRDATSEWTVSAETLQSWKDAYAQGHEIGNHTYYHEHGLQFDQARWASEIKKCNDFLVANGIPRTAITGFRTPFLEYNTALNYALKDAGFEYDNSFEGGWRYWPREEGATLYWPYTMDSGKPAGSEARDFGIAPGLWQMPTDCVFIQDGANIRRITGFDYNVWFAAYSGTGATKAQFLELMKFSLMQKYNGNRSPMNFGTHTNYYSDTALVDLEKWDPASVAKLNTTVAERIAAVKEFLTYAASLPDVRIVTTQQALNWVKNPVALAGGSGGVTEYAVTATAGANGTVTASAATVAKGGDVVFTIAPAAGYKVGSATLNNAAVTVTGNTYTAANVQGDVNFAVTFVEDTVVVGELTATYNVTQDWGTGFGADVVVKNNGTTAVSSWTVIMTFSGDQKVSGWNAQFSQTGNVATVTNLSWNGNLAPGATVSFGMNGSYTGTNAAPAIVVK